MADIPEGYRKADAARLRDIHNQITDNFRISSADIESQNTLETLYEPLVGDANTPIVNDDALDFDVSNDTRPVPLTDIPTSSTNSQKPRTVAAGWAEYSTQEYREFRASGGEVKGKMTVMFRDGTLYNYYDVTPGEWQNFKASVSKGAPWLNKGYPGGKQQVDGLFVNKPRGLADASSISDAAQQTIWRLARSAQVRYRTTRATPIWMGGSRLEMFSESVPKSAARKSGLSQTTKSPRANTHNTSASRPKKR